MAPAKHDDDNDGDDDERGGEEVMANFVPFVPLFIQWALVKVAGEDGVRDRWCHGGRRRR